MTYIFSGPSSSYEARGPKIRLLYAVNSVPSPDEANSVQSVSTSLMEGMILSYPATTMCVLAKAQARQILPSFSLNATPPTSETRKLAPVMTASASKK
ncbi:MAG: hypothetical protein FWG84_06650 [Bacteroidales bacterium]|nr:hypothetical protein [Bacteroidales bacterium]